MYAAFIKQNTGFRLIIILIWTVALFLAGCTPPADPYAPQVLTPVMINSHQIGTSVQGRPIRCIEFGTLGETILILAAIHGDEPASRILAESLEEYLGRNRHLYVNRRILLIPVANPDGLAAGTRDNINKIDLNRNFPADNRQNNRRFGHRALTEPESRALYELIEAEMPARIISIHQPYGCIDYDGPGRSLALRMALWCDLPVQRIGALPGSLGSWAGETMGIPIITLEMTAEDSRLSKAHLWEKYGTALLDFISNP